MFNLMFLQLCLLLSLQYVVAGPTSNEILKGDEGELVFAHVMFRHGERNPWSSYPNDPYQNESKYWPEGGYGQLTNAGKKSQYELGKYFRRRYQQLLGDGSYSPKVIYVQSTDIDRTLMSASACMASMFLPRNDQVWNEELLWQPIPIHTIPKGDDYVLNQEVFCARFDNALQRYQNAPEYQEMLAKHKGLFQYLEEKTGMPVRTLDDVQTINNTLWIQSVTNKTLPEWTKKVFVPRGDMETLSDLCFATNTSTPELARLKSGFLIREILDRFTAKIESKLTPDRSLWIYSAHDSTIASFLNSIGSFELHSPPYGATLMIELYKLKNEFYFQIFYRQSNTEDLSPLNIPKCGTKCSIEVFREAYKEIIPTKSFAEECKL